MNLALKVAVLVLVLAVAGCFGGEPGPATVPPQDDDGRYVIAMTSENHFVPDHALVPRDAVVVWVTEGGAHDVTAANGSWSSNQQGGALGRGETYERALGVPGTHEYVCETHRVLGMNGIVEVSDASVR